MILVKAGSTSLSIDVMLLDDSGLELTGKVAADFPTVYYSFGDNTAAVSISLSDLAAITTSYASGGVKERAAGIYRLDLPDAAIATAGKNVLVYGGASGKHLIPKDIQVVAFNPADGVRLGLTAIPNAVAAASGGLMINGSNTGTPTYSGGMDVNLVKILGTSLAESAGGRIAAAFNLMYNVASPVFTVASVIQTVNTTPSAVMDALFVDGSGGSKLKVDSSNRAYTNVKAIGDSTAAVAKLSLLGDTVTVNSGAFSTWTNWDVIVGGGAARFVKGTYDGTTRSLKRPNDITTTWFDQALDLTGSQVQGQVP